MRVSSSIFDFNTLRFGCLHKIKTVTRPGSGSGKKPEKVSRAVKFIASIYAVTYLGTLKIIPENLWMSATYNGSKTAFR